MVSRQFFAEIGLVAPTHSQATYRYQMARRTRCFRSVDTPDGVIKCNSLKDYIEVLRGLSDKLATPYCKSDTVLANEKFFG